MRKPKTRARRPPVNQTNSDRERIGIHAALRRANRREREIQQEVKRLRRNIIQSTAALYGLVSQIKAAEDVVTRGLAWQVADAREPEVVS